MNSTAKEKRRLIAKLGKVVSATGLSLLLFLGQTAPILANPTGGTVVAGAATIGAAGPTLTINQSTGSAIINWQQFSIANGETTKFIVPSALSATLNRVTGGNPSQIYGNLQSNGILYLVNPSGIVVGPNGRIDTAGFMASTLDVSNQQFLAGGDLHFAGNSNASIDNEGTIHASTGDVYLIANQVNNKGAINAPQGNVGLAAGSDVLFQQAGSQHLFVQATPVGTKRATGVTNSGTISAAAAELRAAGGNAYALAINNTGAIAATGYKKVNGQVYLTSDGGNITNSGKISARTSSGNGGTIVVDGTATVSSSSGTVTNAGVLDASATMAGGSGGSVTLKSKSGTAVHSGQIFAKGGQGGAGGTLDISGLKVSFTGTVDLTAPGGKTGVLIIDPATFTVAPSGGDETGAALAAALATANVTLNADSSVVIDDNVTWTSGNTLTLSTNTTQSSIVIGNAVSGVNGGLVIAGFVDSVPIGVVGAVDVASFILQHGTWSQSGTLPAFTASNDFEIQNSSSFLRVAGGNGSANSPLQITDIYGLEGLGSPSRTFLSLDAELVNNIDASGTTTWHGGAGFVPIGNTGATFNGTFDGQGHTIDSLYINTPTVGYVGMFGATGQATIENLGLTNVHIVGNYDVGGLDGATYNFSGSVINNVYVTGVVTGNSDVSIGGIAGYNIGTISNSHSSATVSAASGTNYVGGVVGYSTGTISNCYNTGTVSGSVEVGGLAGYSGGPISNSYSTGTVNALSGSTYVGGLVGDNGGSISNSYSTGAVNAPGASSYVGGLVGDGSGTISNSYSAGMVTVGSGSSAVGGFAGYYVGTINNSFWDTDMAGVVVGVGGGSSSVVTGATTAQLKSQSYILANSPTTPTWDFTNVWTTNGGTSLPQLIGLPASGPPSGGSGGMGTLGGIAFTDSGNTISPGTTIDLIFDGSLLGSTTTDNSGNYSFSITVSDLTTGLLVTDATDHGNTLYQLNAPSGTSFTGVDIWGNTLIVNSNSLSNAGLKAAAGSLSGVGINYSVNGAALTTNSGINMLIQNGYTLDGNITASGTFTTASGASLTGNQNVTLTGSSVSMSGTFNTTGSITVVSTSGPIDLEGIGDAAATATSLTLDSAGSVTVNDSNIQLSGGNFTATGTGDSFSLDGVDIINSEIDTEGGSYNIGGTAGSDESGMAGIGVLINNSSLITSNSPEITGGNYTITGTSALGSEFTTNSDLDGVYITHSVMDLVNGALSVTGTVGNGTTSGAANGVLIDGASVVHATGTGSLSLTGNTSGTTSSSGNYGVHITGGSIVSAANASGVNVSGINITGTAGDMANEATIATDSGVAIEGGSLVTASGTAPITLLGFGGADTNTDIENNTGSGGVFLTSQTNGETSAIRSNSGAILITGTSGASPRFSFGVNVFGYNGGTAAISSNSGPITINGSTTTLPNSSNELDGVIFQSAAQISSVAGDISITGRVLDGTADFDSSSLAHGVYVFGGSISTSGPGFVSIIGDTTGTTGTSGIGGVLLQNESVSSAAGGITIEGTTSTTSDVSDELFGTKIGDGSTINAVNGAISITGTVSLGTAESRVFGINVNGGSTVSATGSGGNLTLNGNTTGTTSNGIQAGVSVVNEGTMLTAAGTSGMLITGVSGDIGASAIGYLDNNDSIFYEPATAGIAVTDGASLTTTGTAPMTLHGTGGNNSTTFNSDNGYIDLNNGSTPGSYGVAIFSPVVDETTSISSGGNLVVTGSAGSSPISGIGVVAGGPSNRGAVSITSNGSVSLTGTGGAGNTTGSTLPNSGVAIFDPGNNAATVTIHANGGNLTVTGTGGAGADIVGINGAPFFDSFYNSPSFDPTLFSSNDIQFVSLAGKVDMGGLAGGTNALATSVTAPVGTSSYTVFGSNSGTVTLNGGDFTVSEFGGGVSFGPISVTDLAITQNLFEGETPGTTNLSSVTTGNLSITTVGNINLGGAIQASGPVTIQNTGGNITFGPGGSITDSGSGNNVILAAGTDLPTSHYVINNSTAGANAIQVSNGANFYLYSADPAYDSFGGIAVTPDDVLFNAIFATSGQPPANQELFYVATANDVGPNSPNAGVGSNTPPSTQTGGAAGGGSNIVPPALTPNQPPITLVSGTTPIAGSIFQPALVNFVGNGASAYLGAQDSGLANSSGNSGQVGSGDAAQLGGGQLNNVSNPQASSALNLALGPAVYHSLADALKNLGDWADADASAPGGDDTAGGGDQETILSGGDVAVIGDTGVKNIDPDQAPPQLRKAMGGDVLKGMNGGTGH